MLAEDIVVCLAQDSFCPKVRTLPWILRLLELPWCCECFLEKDWDDEGAFGDVKVGERRSMSSRE